MPTVSPRDITGGHKIESTSTVAPVPAAPDASRQPNTAEAAPQGDPALSPKFAALARRERSLLDLDRKIKEREKAIEEREKKFSSQLESDYIPKGSIKERKLQVLLDAGYSRDDIANMLLNEPVSQQTQSSFAEKELEKVRAEMKAMKEETDTKLSERDKRSREQAMKQISVQAETLLKDSPDDFEMVSKNGGAEVIAKFIERTFDEEGVVMNVDEAAKFINEELLEQSLALLDVKTFQAKAREKLLPQAAAPLPEAKGLSITPKQQPIKTLTNQQAAPTGASTSKSRYQRAVLRAKGIDPDAAG